MSDPLRPRPSGFGLGHAALLEGLAAALHTTGVVDLDPLLMRCRRELQAARLAPQVNSLVVETYAEIVELLEQATGRDAAGPR